VFSDLGFGTARNKAAVLVFKYDGREDSEFIHFDTSKDQLKRSPKWNRLTHLPVDELEL
jgi:hypothetical protein